ncbi:MAG: hypothetical protein K8U03_19875 [Planctomycetia bacterium]|nr:hypothetical protein [Planctomycetia bacterium]
MIDGLMKRVLKMIDDVERAEGPLSGRLSREIERVLADCSGQRIAGPEITKLKRIYEAASARKADAKDPT